jgi:hypothetical protein
MWYKWDLGGMTLKTVLLVRVLDKAGNTIGAYYRNVKLPFVPVLGIKLKLSSSVSLWETTQGEELDPPIKEIVYNFDDNTMYCLFEIDEFLVSKYWTQINNIRDNHELKQFKIHLAPAQAC